MGSVELPPVLIVANPYEAELCRKALAPTGISVAISDGGEDLATVLEGDKLAVVVASGLYLSEADEVVRTVRQAAPTVPVLLIAEDEHELSGMEVRQRFYRPVDAEELAHAIERLAVELEGSEDAVDSEPDIVVDAPSVGSLPPEQIPRIATERLDNLDDRAAIVDLPAATPRPGSISASSTTVEPQSPVRKGPSAAPSTDPEPSGPLRLGALMRADEALLDALPTIEPLARRGFEDEEPTRRGRLPTEKLPDRPTPVIGPASQALAGELAALAKSPLLDDIDLDAIDVGAPRPKAAPPVGGQVIADAPTTAATRYDLADEPAPPPALSGTEEEGDLGYVDIGELLSRLYQVRFSGRLIVERSDGSKSIFFEDGLPVAATSDFATDRLGDILHRDGKINRDQHARTRQLQPAFGKLGANELCDAGLLKQREIFALLRRHTEEVLYSLFAWESGSYRLRQQEAPVEDRVRPGQPVLALLLEGLRRKYSLERLSELVGPVETVLSPTTELPRLLAELPLAEGERRAVELIDGDRSLKDILFAERGLPSGISEAALYAVAWLLLCVGGVQSGEGGTMLDSRGLPTQVTPASVGRVRERRERGRDDAGENDAELSIERERIVAKLDQLGDADYFSILGVERHATSHEIRRAYERLTADFAPKRFSVAMQHELGAALGEIGDVLAEAYRVLGDEALRSTYRSHLID